MAGPAPNQEEENSRKGHSTGERQEELSPTRAVHQVAEERYQAFFEAMAEPLTYCRLIRDDEGRVLDCVHLAANHAFRALCGVEDPIGKRSSSLFPSMHGLQPEVLGTCARVATTGEPWRGEVFFPEANAWLELSISSPEADHFLALLRDISERKETEEIIRRSKLTLDHSADYPVWTDIDGRIVGVSQSTCRQLGYSEEELLGMTLFEISPFLTPEMWATHWENIQKEGSRFVEVRHRRKDGTVFPVEVSTNHFAFANKEYDCSICRDITERKAAEETLLRMQFALDHMADYPTWADEQGRIVEVTESTCRHLGYSREELLNMTVFDIDPLMSPETWPARWKSLQEQGSRFLETMHHTKDGRRYPVEIALTYLDFGDRQVECGLCRDVSERRQTEEQLQRAQFALDHIADYPLWLDSEGRIVEVSESTCRTLGYSRDELLSMTVLDLNPALTQEGFRESWQRTKEAGLRYIEIFHRRKNGELLPVELSSTHVMFGGTEYDCAICRDITERRRMEESLILTQLTVDRAPEPITWVTREGRFAYANQAFCDLFGYSREELASLHIWELTVAESPEFFEERWREATNTGMVRHEATLRAKNGTERLVEVSAANVGLGDSRIGVAFVHDLSERRRAEESLRESEERYRLLFELEIHAVILADDDTHQMIDANEAAVELYGYTDSELLSMRDTDLFASLEEARRLSGNPEVDPAVSWHQKKDGTLFPVEASIRHFYWKGRPVHVVAVRDITRRKQAEDALEESRQMLRTVLDAVPLHVLWRGKDLRYLGCNTQAASAAGLPDPDAIAGLTDADLPWGRATGVPWHEDDLEVLNSGVARLQREETVVDPDGGRRVVRTNKVPLRDRAGEIMGLLSVHEDVTTLTETLETLREREEQLRQSQKMEAIGRLAGGIAHDFNNVLTTIIGYSDLILASPGGALDTLADDVGEIRAAAERASSLTKQILAFSRRQGLNPRVLSLNTVIGAAERLLARTIGADVEMRVICEPELGLVEVDEHQFVQVLLNLAVNARDAMPEGGTLALQTKNVDLTEAFCATHPDARPGRYVCVSVADTGVGMDEDTAAHVFEPFYTTKAPGQGTGLGLATVYGVVAQSGGCIYIKTALGRGTTFEIFLPRFDHVLDNVKPTESTLENTSGRTTILLVDDDATFRAVTVRMLEKRGYRVLPVGDGDHAVALLENPDTSVDLVLTDVVLPGATQGVHVSQHAARLRPGVPIIYMSAYSRDTIEKASRLEEGTDYLEKPFTAEHLAQRIGESLGSNGRNATR